MCIAINKPKGALLPKEYIEESYYSNADGAGFAVAVNNRVIIRKGFFTLKAFTEAFEPFQKEAALVHFRIATSGGVNKDMCHPFPLMGGRYALIHNGILSIEHDRTKESDTSAFCRLVLTPLLEAGVSIHSTALKYLIEEAIGIYNKMVILDHKGNSVIFNADSGNEEGGIWYSNHTYLPIQKTGWKDWSGKDWKVKGTLLLPAGTEENTNTEYCWYCGEVFTPADPKEDVLCFECSNLEEAQYYTSAYSKAYHK